MFTAPHRRSLALFPLAVRSALIAAVTLSLSGCFGSDAPAPEAPMKEIPTTDKATVSGAEDELLFKGKRYFEAGLFSDARDNFQALMTQYPLGAYGEFASIKHADSVYELRDYKTAASLYEEIRRNRPTSESTPYLVFRAARSYDLAQKGVGRDMGNLEKAVALYDELAAKFPSSSHAAAATELRAAARLRLSEYERSVADFYQRQSKEKAAQARLARLERELQPQIAADQGVLAKAKEERSSQIASAQQQPLQLPAAAPASTDGAAPIVPAQLAGAKYRLGKAECSATDRELVTVLLSRDLDRSDPVIAEFLSQQRTVTPVNGELTVTVPQSAAQTAGTYPCFDSTGVTLSAAGVITLKTDRTAEVLTLSNPPRVLILFSQHD